MNHATVTLIRIASKIRKDILRAQNSDRVTMFLGGLCDKENAWRKEVKKEFGDRIFFIDPYDKNWEPEDNIYDELCGMLTANYTIFYKGGKGTKREKKFMDMTGGKYSVFDDVEKLKAYLGRVSKKAQDKKTTKGIKKHAYPDSFKDEISLMDIQPKDMEDILTAYNKGADTEHSVAKVTGFPAWTCKKVLDAALKWKILHKGKADMSKLSKLATTIERCPNGKWRIGEGPCKFTSKENAMKAMEHWVKMIKVTAGLDDIASKMEKNNPTIAMAIDQISDRLEQTTESS